MNRLAQSISKVLQDFTEIPVNHTFTDEYSCLSHMCILDGTDSECISQSSTINPPSLFH